MYTKTPSTVRLAQLFHARTSTRDVVTRLNEILAAPGLDTTVYEAARRVLQLQLSIQAEVERENRKCTASAPADPDRMRAVAPPSPPKPTSHPGSFNLGDREGQAQALKYVQTTAPMGYAIALGKDGGECLIDAPATAERLTDVVGLRLLRPMSACAWRSLTRFNVPVIDIDGVTTWARLPPTRPETYVQVE